MPSASDTTVHGNQRTNPVGGSSAAKLDNNVGSAVNKDENVGEPEAWEQSHDEDRLRTHERTSLRAGEGTGARPAQGAAEELDARAEEIRNMPAIPIKKHDTSREYVREKYNSLGTAINKRDGKKVTFYHGVFGKMWRGENSLFAKIAPQLNDLFESSIYGFSSEDLLAGKKRPDGTIHKVHRNIDNYDYYVGKALINGKDYYVRFTVQNSEMKGNSGVHDVMVTDVSIYENSTGDASTSRRITGERLVANGTISDAKLMHLFGLDVNNSEKDADASENVSEPEAGARPAQGTATTTGEDSLQTATGTKYVVNQENLDKEDPDEKNYFQTKAQIVVDYLNGDIDVKEFLTELGYIMPNVLPEEYEEYANQEVFKMLDRGLISKNTQPVEQQTGRATDRNSSEEDGNPDNGVPDWYANLHLSGTTDQNGNPFVLSPEGEIDFANFDGNGKLPSAPIRLSLGDAENGYIHINRRHGKQIMRAGFRSIGDFVTYVANNFTRIKEGEAYDNESGGKNQTYLLQLQDGHNNTLFVQLSRDGSYWNVNSAGVFGKKYGDKKKDVWSASEVQNGEPASASGGLQSEPLTGNGSSFNGTPPNSSAAKVGNSSESGDKKSEKISAIDRIPSEEVTDKTGNTRTVHHWEQAEPGDTYDALTEIYHDNADRVKKGVQNRINAIDKQIKATQKKMDAIDNSDDFDAVAAQGEQYDRLQQQKDALEQQKKYWQGVQSVPLNRRAEQDKRTEAEKAAAKAERAKAEAAAIEEARRERERVNGVPDVVNDTPSDARKRGFRNVNGMVVERQQKTDGVTGRESSVKFSSKDTAQGHIKVIDADELQPSHVSGQRNPQFFIDEAQPKDRTDAASSMAAAKIASSLNPEEITGDGSAYQFSAPTVNSRGEVIQGNNRSDALKLMYSTPAFKAAQDAYKQYIIDHASDFGFTPEDVEKIKQMKHPVMVNELDVSDDEAIRLGQMKASDNESGGIERIDPVTTSKKLGSKVGSFARILLSSGDEDASLSDVLAENGGKAVQWLRAQGVISDTAEQSAFDKKGNLTAEAKQDLQNILKQSLFEGGVSDLPTMFERMPAKAQKAILSTFMRDFDSAESERILPEIQKAIEAWYGCATSNDAFAKAGNYKSARAAMRDWTLQTNMLDDSMPSDKFSNFAMELACRLQGCTMREVQQNLNDFFDLVQGKSQGDLFGGTTMGEQADRQEAIKRIFNIEYNPINNKNNGKNGSNAVADDNSQGGEGRPGSTGDGAGRERTAGTEQPADVAGGTEGDDEKGKEVTQQHIGPTSSQEHVESEREVVNTEPTEKQKEAGNYKKGHIKVDGYDITIENPKGSTRSGKDASGKAWSVPMHYDYGYIKGTEGVDGDHIDVYLSDEPTKGNVYVIDQVNQNDGSFDEHKVMYGFPSMEAAIAAYKGQYEDGWKVGTVTEVSREDFKKWVESSHRKTKPFAEYRSIQYTEPSGRQKAGARPAQGTATTTDDGLVRTHERTSLQSGEKGDVKQMKAGGGVVSVSKREAALRDAVMDLEREAGLDVIDDVEEGQRVLDMANGRVRQMSFGEPYDYDAYPLGRVEPNLAEKEVAVVEADANHGFANYKEAKAWAKQHVSKVYNNEETGGKGDVRISNAAIDKFMSQSAVDKSDGKDVHMSVLKVLPEVLKNSIDVETHPDFLKGADGKRRPENGMNKDVLVHRCYGAVSIDGKPYRVKITLKEDPRDVSFPHVTHSYEATKIELLAGTWENQEGPSPNTNNSIPAANLLKNVGLSYNPSEKVLTASEKRTKSIREQRVYHGSAADFDAFDHSHMGEGEGAQAHGWGTYVTKNKGVGMTYASKSSKATGLKRSELESNIHRAEDQLPYLHGDVKAEKEKELKAWKDELAKLNDTKLVYTVEIPDDTGDNYLEEAQTLQDLNRPDMAGRIDKVMDDYFGAKDFWNSWQTPGLAMREEFIRLSMGQHLEKSRRDAERKFSNLLSEAGVVGLHYNGHKDGDCYVIFNDKDLKIKEKVRFFRTADGDAYGYTVGGKIYIDPRIATSETPIHEYAHLWAEALRKANPKEWQNVVELMKECKSVWEQVKKEYPELKTDDEIADEVLAHYSGRRGAERLRQEAAKAADAAKGVLDKASVVSAFGRLREAIRKAWKHIAEDILHIHFTSADEVADKMMYDLLNKVKPGDANRDDSGYKEDRRYRSEDVETANKRFNEELDAFKNKTSKGLLHLGTPSPILRSCGVAVKELTLSPSVLHQHLKKHGLTTDDLKNLVMGLRNPMLVYIHGLNVPNMVVVTSFDTPKGKLSIALRLDNNGQVVGINNISSVHGKDVSTEIDRLHEMGNDLGSALKYVDKEKVSNWLMSSPYMEAGTPNQQKLLSVAKIINDFENPVIKGENVSEPEVGARSAQGAATTTDDGLVRTHERTSLQSGVGADGYEAERSEIERRAKEDGTWMKAPNGRRSNLSENQWVTVRTKQFKDWFGDWENDPEDASQTLDENGEPKVFYHNTDNDFTVFDANKNGTHTDAGWLGDGFYFYGDENEGDGYGHKKMAVFLNVRNMYYATSAENEELAEANDRERSVEFREEIEDEGYDGVYYNGDLRQEAVVFYPEQIKSATDNIGTFDASNPDIRYHRVDERNGEENDDAEAQRTHERTSLQAGEDSMLYRMPSERREKRDAINHDIDSAISFVTGKSIKEVKAERLARERQRKVDFENISKKVLSGDFDDVTLQQINKFIDDATPKNPFGRRISQRLPQKMERGLHEGERTNSIDALFSRICESAVPANGRFSKAGRREVESIKEKALRGWAQSTGHWYADISELIYGKEPIASGNDSDVYISKDKEHVIKLSKGKFDAKIPSDVDAIALFNYVFPNSAYRILGYGEKEGHFVKVLEQPFVDFSSARPLTVDERVSYMHSIGFEPINKDRTMFSNGNIVVTDIQKSNIVKDQNGNVRVIDADVKLHTKDLGGNYTYLPVENDFPDHGGALSREGDGAYTDDELSEMNDPFVKMLGEKARSAKQRKAFAARERRNMADAVRELAERLHLDNVEIVTEPMEVKDRRGKVHHPKGFYNTKTGKITVVIPNHANVDDAVQTLLHEAVAHYGLRQLFGEHFDTFLRNVYEAADMDVRRRITELALRKYGGDFRVATEEYLASLAEKTDFENMPHGFWQKIKRMFLAMLHAIGFDGFADMGVTLSDNELRYILWRSYENLKEPGEHRSILGEAEDVAKLVELKVGNYGETAAEEEPADVAERREEKIGRLTPDFLQAFRTWLLVKRDYDKSVRDDPTSERSQALRDEFNACKGWMYDAMDMLHDLDLNINLRELLKDNGFNERELEEYDYWFGGDGVAEEEPSGAGYVDALSDEVSAYPKRVQDWLSQGNLDRARGKNLKEIIAMFGNKPEPIAYVPKEYLYVLGNDVTDNRLYSGKGYFIDHALNHHSQIETKTYGYIQEVLSHPDAIKPTNEGVTFIKKIDRWNAVVVNVEKTEKGKIIWHKSFYDQNKEIYKNRPDLKKKEPSVDATPTINPAAKAVGSKRNVSTLDDSAAKLGNNVGSAVNKGENVSEPEVWEQSHDENVGERTHERTSLQNGVGNRQTGARPAQGAATTTDEGSIRAGEDNSADRLWTHERTSLQTGEDRLRTHEGTSQQNGENRLRTHEGTSQQAGEVTDARPEAWGKKDLLSKAEQISNGVDPELLFRDSIEDDDNTARETYNRMADEKKNIIREAWQDSMINVRNLQDAVLKQRGEKPEAWEDAYNEENRMHGRSRAESEYFTDNFYKPLLKAVNAVAKAAKVSVGDVTEYMMAKHGLERNIVFASRDAQKAYDKAHQKAQEEYEALMNAAFAESDAKKRDALMRRAQKVKFPDHDELYNHYRGRDYSGLTDLTGKDDVQEAEAEAQRIVADMESRSDTSELWKVTNAATEWTLKKAYESGMMSRDNYDYVRSMFSYYIPLRGWEEDTAEDLYDYVGGGNKGDVFSPTVHKAWGRRTQADNPIAYIGSMAVSAIVQGNKNKVKQTFMRFAENHPTNLVTVSEMWYRNYGTDAAPDWREAHEHYAPFCRSNKPISHCKKGLFTTRKSLFRKKNSKTYSTHLHPYNNFLEHRYLQAINYEETSYPHPTHISPG